MLLESPEFLPKEISYRKSNINTRPLVKTWQKHFDRIFKIVDILQPFFNHGESNFGCFLLLPIIILSAATYKFDIASAVEIFYALFFAIVVLFLLIPLFVYIYCYAKEKETSTYGLQQIRILDAVSVSTVIELKIGCPDDYYFYKKCKIQHLKIAETSETIAFESENKPIGEVLYKSDWEEAQINLLLLALQARGVEISKK